MAENPYLPCLPCFRIAASFVTSVDSTSFAAFFEDLASFVKPMGSASSTTSKGSITSSAVLKDSAS